MGGDIVLSVKYEYDICQALVIVVVMTHQFTVDLY